MRALIVAAVLAGGCGHVLTQDEIASYGTKAFAAPQPKVFKAVVQALQLEGYDVPVQNADKGAIRTARKLVRADAIGDGNYARAVAITRQYYVDLRSEGDGRTSVVVTPRVYRGEADLSERAVWVLDGADGERALWSKLFRDIGDQL